MKVIVKEFFDAATSTFTYVISDVGTGFAAIIDSVLAYDIASGRVSTEPADEVIKYVLDSGLNLQWLLETHIHADHLTAANYIKGKLGGQIAIGYGVIDVLRFWTPKFNTAGDTPADGSQFDALLGQGDVICLGDLKMKVMSTPGHTSACLSYVAEGNAFVGDTLFMPDVGTARTDFPGGGNAGTLYDSIREIMKLPDETLVYVGHDYPPMSRGPVPCATVAEQKSSNIMINSSVTRSQYVDARVKKDRGKKVPLLILPALQFNLRAGSFGLPDENGMQYARIPINFM